MFDGILNTPLNEIWDRKKERNNYFPGWKVCLACTCFFHWFQVGYAYKRYAYKKTCSFSIKLSWLYRRSIKVNTILYDRYYLQNCKVIIFKKISNRTKYKKLYVSSHLHIFWLKFDKANHSFFPPFLLLRETDSLGEWVISFCLGCNDKNLGASFDWGGAWVKMPRINPFSRNVNSINLKILPTHGGI